MAATMADVADGARRAGLLEMIGLVAASSYAAEVC
jgi:hypothetical protein